MIEYIKPDIILSDIQMPGLDGFTMNSKIQEYYPELRIPVQFISSTNSKKLIERANSLGINQLIHKPVKANVLSECLFKAIDKFAAA